MTQREKKQIADESKAGPGKSPAKGKKAFQSVRGRPTVEQAAAISRTILDNARTLFLRNGFDSTTMDAIAKESGIPKSTLYKRYNDKMSLLRAVVEDRLITWSESSSQLNVQLSNDLEQRLKQRLHTVLTWNATEEVRAFSRLAHGSGESAAMVSRILQDTGYAAMLKSLERDILDLADSSPSSVKDPAGVAVVLMATLTGWIVLTPQDQKVSIVEASAFADKAVEFALYGRAAW